MRTGILGAVIVMAAIGQASAADMPVKAQAVQQGTTAGGWTATADIDFRYFSWERTLGNPFGETSQKGWQFYMPFGIAASGQLSENWKLDLVGRGGYVDTSRSADPGDGIVRTATVSTLTDSILGATFTYQGINGFVPFYSINLSLPTGTTTLLGYDALARTDPDLVDVPAFGAGFNHSHTLGANIAFSDSTLLTVTAAYTNRGAFTREAGGFGLPPPGTETYDPGDNVSVSAGLTTQLGSLTLAGSVAGSWDTASTIDAVEALRPGFNLLLSGNASYQWNDANTSTLSVSWTHTNRNYFPGFVDPALVVEPLNSNNDVFSAGFEHAVMVNARAQLFGTVNYLDRRENAYDPATFTFVPAKTKMSLGAGVRYAVTQTALLNVKAQHFWTDEKDYPALFIPEQKYQGYMVSVGGTVKF